MAVRRLTTLASVCGSALSASALAQPLLESFDAISGLPLSGWVAVNHSQPPGGSGWFQGDVGKFGPQASTGYLASDYHCVSTIGTISNWELLPPRTLTNGDAVQFWTRTVSPTNYADRLQVRMSTAGAGTNIGTLASDVGDFSTLLLDINPGYTIEGTGIYPETWTQYTIILSGLPGPVTGRIGLRYFVEQGGPGGPNSDYIGIDTVEYLPGGVRTGRCCNTATGACTVTTPTSCVNEGGVYAGDNTTCTGFTCPQPPTGACCLAEGTCAVQPGPTCLAAGGLYKGNGSVCGGCPVSFVYVGSPIGLQDGNGATGCGPVGYAEVFIPTSFTIAEAQAAFVIRHPYQGDLKISLRKVGGPVISLVDRPAVPAMMYGFSADHYGVPDLLPAHYFRLSDLASTSYDVPAVAAPGISGVSGTWKPESRLADLAGVNSTGTWRLEVTDCAGGGTGEIQQFALILTPTEPLCYANCDFSTAPPVLNANDFTCFLNLFAASDPRANCDGSLNEPVLNALDFTCFLSRFSAGCS